jgi:hypothetical protein
MMILGRVPFQAIEWANNTRAWSVEDMSIDHRCFNGFMTKQFLNLSNIITSHQQVSSKGMAKNVGRDMFGDIRPGAGTIQWRLENASFVVVPHVAICCCFMNDTSRRENPLPFSVPKDLLVFAMKGAG